MNAVYVNVIAWCDIIKSGCGVIGIHMMSYILCLCYHTYNEGYMIDNLGVMTEIEWMCCRYIQFAMRYNRLMYWIEG